MIIIIYYSIYSIVQSSLPSIDILQKSNSKPVILHLIGGGKTKLYSKIYPYFFNFFFQLFKHFKKIEIPSAVSKSIVTVEKNEKGPSLNEIQTVLRNHKIQAETKEMVEFHSLLS